MNRRVFIMYASVYIADTDSSGNEGQLLQKGKIEIIKHKKSYPGKATLTKHSLTEVLKEEEMGNEQ